MMSHKDPNRLGDRIIFWFAASVAFMFFTQAVYDFGYSHGAAKCSPAIEIPKRPISYDTPQRQLKRWIRFEKAKGQP